MIIAANEVCGSHERKAYQEVDHALQGGGAQPLRKDVLWATVRSAGKRQVWAVDTAPSRFTVSTRPPLNERKITLA